MFNRQDLPVYQNEVVRRWSYLKEKANEIPQLDSDIRIGLLNGVNCPASLRPIQFIKEDDFLTRIVGKDGAHRHRGAITCLPYI